MRKYVNDSMIVFIFMTDGEDRLPISQINQIKQLRASSKNKIHYCGIEFQNKSNVMQEINR